VLEEAAEAPFEVSLSAADLPLALPHEVTPAASVTKVSATAAARSPRRVMDKR
jgi:hypothetical protein